MPRTTLNEEELGTLNRIVNAYIEIAELQAQSRKTMTLHDRSDCPPDDFLMTEREALTHAGKVAAEVACWAAEAEFEHYREQRLPPQPCRAGLEAAISKPMAAVARPANRR
ncbi:MAG: virulence RhuM family protein [Burkholderiales bacterium]|nr:virulence RhuM family protein [Burkholderiales bacterium]